MLVLTGMRSGHDGQLLDREGQLIGGARLDERDEPEWLDGRAHRDDDRRVADGADDLAPGVDLHDVPAMGALHDPLAEDLHEHGRGDARLQPRGPAPRRSRRGRGRCGRRDGHVAMVSRAVPSSASSGRVARSAHRYARRPLRVRRRGLVTEDAAKGAAAARQGARSPVVAPGSAAFDWLLTGLTGLITLGGYLLVKGSREGTIDAETLVSTPSADPLRGSASRDPAPHVGRRVGSRSTTRSRYRGATRLPPGNARGHPVRGRFRAGPARHRHAARRGRRGRARIARRAHARSGRDAHRERPRALVRRPSPRPWGGPSGRIGLPAWAWPWPRPGWSHCRPSSSQRRIRGSPAPG